MRDLFKALSPYLWRYRRGLAAGVGALLLKDLFGAALPLAMKYGVDSLTSGFRIEIVLEFAAALIVLSLLKGIAQYWMRVILIGISRDIEFDLRNELFSKLVTLSSDFYARTRTGDIMARTTNDLNAVRMMLGPGIMYTADTTLTAVLSIAIMLAVDWRLALLALIPGPLVSFAMFWFGRRIHALFEHIQALFSDISSRVQENLSGVRVIRAYVQEEAELKHFEDLNDNYLRESMRLGRLSAVFMPLVQALIGLTFLIVLGAGGYLVLHGRITLGSFVMFNTYMGLLVWPMIALGWVVNLLQRGNASWNRIMDILQQKPTIRAPLQPVVPPDLAGEIRLRDVTVRYSTGTSLRDLDLLIPAGITAAIAGHTGSGKTTLVNLIPRLIDPDEGSVLLDGYDVRMLDPEWIRAHIGFVPQESFLFSTTLAENIGWGLASPTHDQIEQAAIIAGLGPDIAAFPSGYNTMIGERGLTLSGGQKQRVALARAIIRNPRILILDDALSSVDTITEARILEGLSGVMRDRTTILISHRVSTVQNADHIFVLERGELVESGTHAELIANGGFYADLYQKQLLEEELEAI